MPVLNVTALVDAWEREVDTTCTCCEHPPTWGEFLVSVVNDPERWDLAMRESAVTVLLSHVRHVTVPD